MYALNCPSRITPPPNLTRPFLQDVDAIPVQDEMQGVTPSETIVSVAPVRAGPDVIIINSEGTQLKSPEQKSQSRFSDFYHDLEHNEEEDRLDGGLSKEAYNARVPKELGGFLRM